jgi:iron complex transport system ATP-binding protein
VTGAEVLALRGATVRAGGRTILGPVDLTVHEREHWVVLGPNGSGKTTMLSRARGLREPSAGGGRVLGARLGRVDVRRLRTRIGHVSHTVADRLRPELPVQDVVLTGKASVLETWWQELTDRDRTRARALLDDVGCLELSERTLGTCSLGERQRVLIARALFGEHPLLLFDEPAAGLDLPARERLLAAMTSATTGDDPPTTMLATHHLEEIPTTATHAALLREGRLVATGRAADVLTDAGLSACYGLDVVVERRDGRWWARAR